MSTAALAGIICTISVAVIGGFVKLVLHELAKNRAETEKNRGATEQQFSDQNEKIEENFRSVTEAAEKNFRILTDTATKTLVQTTKTNGRVDSHDERIKEHTDEIRILREAVNTRATRAPSRRR